MTVPLRNSIFILRFFYSKLKLYLPEKISLMFLVVEYFGVTYIYLGYWFYSIEIISYFNPDGGKLFMLPYLQTSM